MIVWLASYPRSGNGFFRAISRQLFDVNSYSVYPEIGRYLDKNEISERAGTENSILVKTHELPRDQYRAIYLVRDGRDSVISYAHWILSQETGEVSIDPQSRQFQKRLRDVIATTDHFGGWSAHVLAWYKRPNTWIVRFEDLIVEPVRVISQALEFANLPSKADPESHPFDFETLHARDPVIYRNGIIGNWESEMSPAMQKLYWRKCGSAMKLLGYT